MGDSHSTLALIFDFDETLVPDSTTQLLESGGIDPVRFWTTDAKALVASGYDPSLAYLKLILSNIGAHKPLGNLTNQALREFGKRLDKEFFSGIPGVFKDLKKIVSQYKDITLEFYIISGGLQEVIAGSKVVQEYFSAWYGCQLAGDTKDDPLKYIKRCVTFTEKTRYIFEINKGVEPGEGLKNPYKVNEDVPLPVRRIPFKNMIYVGDGLTDIPCFSLVQKQGGGKAFGIFKPAETSSAKRTLVEFLAPKRVISSHAAKYKRTDELGSLLRAAIATRCSDIMLERGQAEKPTY